MGEYLTVKTPPCGLKEDQTPARRTVCGFSGCGALDRRTAEHPQAQQRQTTPATNSPQARLSAVTPTANFLQDNDKGQVQGHGKKGANLSLPYTT